MNHDIIFDFVLTDRPYITISINGVCTRFYLTDKDREHIAHFIATATKWLIRASSDE